MQRLLCKKELASLKRSNVSRHYNTCHKKKYDTCSTQCWVEILWSLKQEYKIENETQGNGASYVVALEIIRTKKNFFDRELAY